ncbi:MAG: chemotaxis protein CheA [Desulfuromonadaceae bacterium]|nr:chemotaxis protein CheA [Desulfuromonadaceae bacterium]MDD2847818.1 chemotaxis protein CheA [Desulfuromonadaceae bacterium]MDD4129637.1 chemotaxis protein CheA [Desulfuromonadaceae bacterium]
MMEEAIATYREEAGELLAELETSLLDLEETPDDNDLINRVFRAMHTIKGSGAMFGFDEIASFTHEVETVFDMVRNGKMTVTKRLLDLTLKSRDHISYLLSCPMGEEVDRSVGDEIIAGLRQLVPQQDTPQKGSNEVPALHLPPVSEDELANECTWRIRFRPAPNVLMCGTNPISLINELRGLGTAHVVAQFDEIPQLDALVAENCYIYWDIILTTTRGEDAIKDVFIFVEDDCDIRIELIDSSGLIDKEDGYKKLGDILVERGDLSPIEMQKVLMLQKRFGELLVEQGIVSPEKVQSALVEQQHVKSVRKERSEAPPQEAAASIRVPAERLDQLINLVGEMVTVQAHLSQVSQAGGDATFIAISEEVERLTNELRDTALNIRMLPIGSTFSKFKRLVRDLSSELGKEIEMETFGAETELDKTVIEKLNDPLVHIIRNCIDHGIEMPEVRKAAGKASHGTVSLGAEHSGDSVLVTIRDDGGGLDRDRIRAKAIERGLLSATAEVPDKEIYAQIFAPGFSTAEKVTSVSGRGVGMDVVKRGIDSLRGSIGVDSVRGTGTTITLKIPLTLAIIDSLLVKIGKDHFVLPLASVEECVELTREDIRGAHGRNLANVRGAIIPYIPLREHFKITDQRPDIEQIVIADIHGTKVGFVVDHVVGEHQTVIKSLGKMYRDVKGVSGATILGDGTVALILDMGVLLQSIEKLEHIGG